MDGLRWTLLIIAVLIIAGIYWWGRRMRRTQGLQEEEGQAGAPGAQGQWHDPEDVLMAEEFERLSGMISSDRGGPHRQTPPPQKLRAAGPVERPAASARAPRRDDDTVPMGARPSVSAPSSPPASPPTSPAAPRRAPPQQPAASASSEPSALAPPEPLILVLHVMAREGLLHGERIGAALAGADMQFGDMNVYHRLDVDGQSLFSAASMIKPGTLTAEELPALRTPGIALFMQAPLQSTAVDVKQAFEEMLEAARAVAQALGAELRDETRSVLTPQTVAHLRERVEVFEFKQRVGARSR